MDIAIIIAHIVSRCIPKTKNLPAIRANVAHQYRYYLDFRYKKIRKHIIGTFLNPTEKHPTQQDKR